MQARKIWRFLILSGLSLTATAEADLAIPFSQLALHPERSSSATALSLNNSTISSELLAKVTNINVRVSQPVKQGDTLLQLDCASYQLNLRMAKARTKAAKAGLELAKSQLKRANQLSDKSLISQELLDSRNVEMIARQAELERDQVAESLARLDEGKCTIQAPFDGIVTARSVGVGQLANVGTPLLTLVDTGSLELSASVNYEEALLFQKVEAFSFNYGQQVPVQLENIGGVIDSQNRNQEVRFQFTATRPLPGTAGKLVWSDPRPFMPAKLIVTRNGQRGVFILEADTARFVPLPQAVPGRPSPVELDLDTLIITRKLGSLQDGQTF